MGRTHLAAYKTMDNAQVTAVCDLNEEQGRALAAEAGCAWYGDGGAMLAEAGVDVVDICLPTFCTSSMRCWPPPIKTHPVRKTGHAGPCVL